MSFTYFEYQYPIAHLIHKHVLFLDKNCNVYFACKALESDDWSYYAGNASHALTAGGYLSYYGSVEATAQANYLTTTRNAAGKFMAILPTTFNAKYVRLYIQDGANVTVYEWIASTYFSAHEIISGEIRITDELTDSPLFVVEKSNVDRIKIGNFTGTTYGIAGYDASSNKIFELSDAAQTIGGWNFTSTLLRSATSGTRVELDSLNMRISIFDNTNEKVVMGYLNGLPKNDGSGNWGVADYGFWARNGDSLQIDGDAEYINGDWIVKNDAAYLIVDGDLNTIVRLGSVTGERGLYIYDADGNLLARYSATGILIGNVAAGQYLSYTPVSGLSIAGSATFTGGTLDYDNITGAHKPANNATVGATWGTNLSNRPANLASLAGSENINNASITVDTNGVLQGIGTANKVVDNTKQLWAEINNVPAVLAAPSGSGLFLSADHMGFYTASAWKTYIDNSGNFLLGNVAGGGTGISWNQGTGSLTIVGNITITTGSVPNAIVTGLGALATKSSVDLTTGDVTNKSLANLDSTANNKLAGIAAGATVGAIWGTNLSNIPATLATPAGSGLFLSSSCMGYYASNTWKTYIDNSGNFVFGDVAGGNSGISWNQGTGSLTIRGAITIVSGSVPNSVVTGLGGLALKSSVDLNSGEVTNKSLANLDSTANTKLSGIAAGATVGATWGSNLSNIPSTLGAPSGSGLFLSADYMGYYASNAWKTYIDSSGNMILGNPAGAAGLSWNQGTGVLTIKGSITLVNTIPSGSVSGLGSLATKSSVDLNSGEVTNKSLSVLDSAANTKLSGIAANADVTLSVINGGLTVTGGGITLSNGGSIKAGQSDYNTGTGFFFGYSGSAYKASMGTTTKGWTWDGATFTIKGDVVATGNIIDNAVTNHGVFNNAALVSYDEIETVIATVTVNANTASDVIVIQARCEISVDPYEQNGETFTPLLTTVRLRKTNVSGTILDTDDGQKDSGAVLGKVPKMYVLGSDTAGIAGTLTYVLTAQCPGSVFSVLNGGIIRRVLIANAYSK